MECIYIKKTALLQQYLNTYQEQGVQVIGLDIETMGENPLDPRKGSIRLVQLSGPGLPILIIDWHYLDEDGRSVLKQFLESDVIKVLHNAKFDMKFLKINGIDIKQPIFDTYLAAAVLKAGLNPGLKLNDVVKEYLNYDLPKEEQCSDWSLDPLTETQLIYAAKDAWILLPLREKLIQELFKADLVEIANLEFNALPAMVEMELNGIRVNVADLSVLEQNLQAKHQLKQQELQTLIGRDVNVQSTKQLKEALKDLGLEVSSTKSEDLSKLNHKHPVIAPILDIKVLTKQLQFAKKIPAAVDANTGRLYSNYLQLGAKTGRLSCSNFNLQQVPHDPAFRELFVPAEGNVFVISDYSQMQIRIAAEISGDQTMLDAYEQGMDLHSLTASRVSGVAIDEVTKAMRSEAKALNFGMLFGMGWESLITYAWGSYGVLLTPKQAHDFIDKFFQTYHGLKQWQNKQGRQVTKKAYTLGKRRQLFPEKARYTQLVNTPIQGTEADILKTVLSILPDLLKETSGKLIACIHDEIVVECCKDDGEMVQEILKTAMELAAKQYLKTVPVVAEAHIASSWAEK